MVLLLAAADVVSGVGNERSHVDNLKSILYHGFSYRARTNEPKLKSKIVRAKTRARE